MTVASMRAEETVGYEEERRRYYMSMLKYKATLAF